MRYLLYTVLAGSMATGAWVVQNQELPEPPVSEQDPSPSPPDNEPAPTRSQEEELEPFTPSEKVPADSAISFPVDI